MPTWHIWMHLITDATLILFSIIFFFKTLFFFLFLKDLDLAKALIRPGSLFINDLSKSDKFSDERYGSVPRVYVVCNEDKGIPEEFQRWMIENFEVNDVMEIKDADHMAMFSKPQELFNCLSQIANKYGWYYCKSWWLEGLFLKLDLLINKALLSWRFGGII